MLNSVKGLQVIKCDFKRWAYAPTWSECDFKRWAYAPTWSEWEEGGYFSAFNMRKTNFLLSYLHKIQCFLYFVKPLLHCSSCRKLVDPSFVTSEVLASVFKIIAL